MKGAALCGFACALATACSGCAALRDFPAHSIVGPMAARALVEPGEAITVVAGDGVRLHGYLVRAVGASKGTVVFLHGAYAQAAFWSGEAVEMSRLGYDVVACDARGHGRSGGLCSYGAREREDVRAIVDEAALHGARVARVLLFGFSMGAGVALYAAPLDARVRGVVAVAPYATLARVLGRVAWAAPQRALDEVVAAAERVADFDADAVRPLAAAAYVRVPLLVVAGADDPLAPPADARAIVAAANAPHPGDANDGLVRARLLIVDGATHDDVLPRCGVPCAEAFADLLRAAGMR